MIGVKLTIVLFVIIAVSIIVLKAVVSTLDFKTKLLIGLHKGPKWYENIAAFLGFLVLLDLIGVIYIQLYGSYFLGRRDGLCRY